MELYKWCSVNLQYRHNYKSEKWWKIQLKPYTDQKAHIEKAIKNKVYQIKNKGVLS